MTDAVAYHPMPISTDDFLRLKAAMGDRDGAPRDGAHQLRLLHTDAGEDFIAVMLKGWEDPFYTVRRAVEAGKPPTAKPHWLVHYEGGTGCGLLFEFPSLVDVANFFVFEDVQGCTRSWLTGRSEPGLIVGGEMPAVPKAPQGTPEPTPASRGRHLPHLPMLGDRAAGE
jgi:hypothetical protein